MTYVLPKLPYAYDALEPFIDTKTMQVHHLGHHKTYVDKLNKAMEAHPEYRKPVDVLLTSLGELPLEVRSEVVKNGGGHANHTLFWTLLTPKKGREPSGEFASVLKNNFGRLSSFKEKFNHIAIEHFSNGWAWLCADPEGSLKMFSSRDHESPLTQGLTPLLTLDLWEHAYYLKHQNRRPEFVEAFWSVLNWDEVGERWNEFQRAGGTQREWRIAS
jgi:superoxide dismutase, Fe-Mn family